MILHAEPPDSPLGGSLRPPGDKSISHRALILAGLAAGQSRIGGLLLSADTRATWCAMEQLGARISQAQNRVMVEGVGAQGLRAPQQVLDMGNSGTAMRLLAGVLAAQPFNSVLSGDASLNQRPMNRIIEPLERMGARIRAEASGTAPLRITGNPALQGIEYTSPVASAQVKSCILLAGLYAKGTTSVSEPRLSRDHTERMLPLFGIDVTNISVRGGQTLQAADLSVPADPSSAAFLAAAALLVPGSDLVLKGVGMNPTRAAFFDVLQSMGANIVVTPAPGSGSGERLEPVADLRVRHGGELRGVDVPEEWVPALIDEIPILLALSALAHGTTRIRGAGELRVKESDRLAVMATGLAQLGLELEELDDGIDLHGGQPVPGEVHAADDHRCAMSFTVLGQAVPGGVRISGAANIDTSYPGFAEQLRSTGGRVWAMAATT